MRPLRYFRHWWGLGGAYVLVIIWASLSSLPLQMPMPVWDKLLHGFAYLSLTAWFGSLYLPAKHGWILALAVFLGLTLECLQAATVYRNFEWADLIANCLGAAGGTALAQTRLGEGLMHLERHFFVTA